MNETREQTLTPTMLRVDIKTGICHEVFFAVHRWSSVCKYKTIDKTQKQAVALETPTKCLQSVIPTVDTLPTR